MTHMPERTPAVQRHRHSEVRGGPATWGWYQLPGSMGNKSRHKRNSKEALRYIPQLPFQLLQPDRHTERTAAAETFML
jgi:hypothetical protein